MKRAIVFFFLFLLSSSFSFANVNDFREETFLAHLDFYLESLQEFSSPLIKKSPSRKEEIYQEIEALRELKKRWPVSFQRNLRKIESKQRELFKPLSLLYPPLCLMVGGPGFGSACMGMTNKLFKDLDPNCSPLIRKSFNGTIEPFPCMAGQKFTLKLLKPWKESSIEKLEEFNRLFTETTGNKIDLWPIYQASFGGTREEFWGFMSFFMGASTGFAGTWDTFWIETFWELINSHHSPQKVLSLYHRLQETLLYLHTIQRWHFKYKEKLIVDGYDISSWNRHDVFGALLSCHYRYMGKDFVKTLNFMTDAAYEGMDFLYKIKGKKINRQKLKKLYENLKNDTKKHIQASELGYEFCHNKN